MNRAIALVLLGACTPPAPESVQAHQRATPPDQIPVVSFVDFECSYCRAAHSRLEHAARDIGVTLAIRYYHVPLRSHRTAAAAAQAHVCAEAQGQAAAMARALFEEPNHDLQHLIATANALGVPEETFVTCMAAEATQARLASDRAEFIEQQFDGVPVMFIGDQKIDGAHKLTDYAAALRAARK